MKFVCFIGMLACCYYTNVLQFCRVSHGAVKLNTIRNAVFGISKSNTVTGFCCLRRQDTFTLLIQVIYKFCNAGSGVQTIFSACVSVFELFPFLEGSENSQVNRQFGTNPTSGLQKSPCSLSALN